ncbi:MAG: hypothetical protein V7645_3064 [Actinomycetota bacterium]|jgi:hypothetical protein
MFSIKVTGSFRSLERHEFEVPCPRCSLHTWVSLRLVLRRDVAVCRGCHANILLIDHLGAVQQMVRRLDASLGKLFKLGV